jgi:hypothetical protein
MGFKHLFGFCLLMTGIGLAPLFFLFMGDRKVFNPVFLLSMGICAIASVFLGLFILKKAR